MKEDLSDFFKRNKYGDTLMVLMMNGLNGKYASNISKKTDTT
mgnify:CR=1 FL=1